MGPQETFVRQAKLSFSQQYTDIGERDVVPPAAGAACYCTYSHQTKTDMFFASIPAWQPSLKTNSKCAICIICLLINNSFQHTRYPLNMLQNSSHLPHRLRLWVISQTWVTSPQGSALPRTKTKRFPCSVGKFWCTQNSQSSFIKGASQGNFVTDIFYRYCKCCFINVLY